MRKLIVTRGHPGSGKSTVLRELGLADWTLSSDTIRTVLTGPVLREDGSMMLDQDINKRAFPLLNQLADERMGRGETLAIDTTLLDRASMKDYMDLARKHRYDVAMLDLSPEPVEAALARNESRAETRRVAERRVLEMHARLNGQMIPSEGTAYFGWREDGSHINDLKDWMEVPSLNLNSYAAVEHIGDLQGCITVLAGPGGPLENGLREDIFYVFVGDLVDRGIENGKVLRWFLENAVGRPNVALLWGNHETHLHRYATGQAAVSEEFQKRTLPQIIKEGITPEDVDVIMNMARDVLLYHRGETNVLVTHAGMGAMPSSPHLVSRHQYSNGTGWYETPIDAQFENNAPHMYQVHGHRNSAGLPVRASRNSFNLEDSVEHGGSLRTCRLSDEGWSVGSYQNHVYRSYRERLPIEKRTNYWRNREMKKMPGWMNEKRDVTISEETLAAMREHSGVVERQSELFPHISSLNFTKKVFYQQAWDDIVVKARGLFFDRDSREIVARGYEKFFNVGEREGARLEDIQNMTYPLTLYIKENGFLGNIGYDARTDSLFVASKSTPDGRFAQMFRDILDDTMNRERQEKLKRYLRDNEASMTFEVIDPVNDPHIIAYDAPKIILLDVLHRSESFERVGYDQLKAVAESFGLECKSFGMVFKDFRAFSGWFEKASNDLGFKMSGKNIEGLVVEDAEGRMCKVKLPYYDFWKMMRGAKERMLNARKKEKPFSWELTRMPSGATPPPEAIELSGEFIDWCHDQDDDVLQRDIIDLRNMFGRDFGDEKVQTASFAPR